MLCTEIGATPPISSEPTLTVRVRLGGKELFTARRLAEAEEADR
jgi:hypothetical protein